MGNAGDCNYCDNRGKPWSFGCPRCGRFDRNAEQDVKRREDAKKK